jgi:hypothetical protein
MHGVGVVSGLEVSVTNKGQSIVIAPGVAIDPLGEEIEVSSSVTLPLAADAATLRVQLRYAERLCKPVVMPSTTGGDVQQYSRIVDTFEPLVSVDPIAGAVVIARLRRAKGRWSVAKRSGS